MNYIDPCLPNSKKEIIQKARQLGWESPANYSSKILTAENWGELKRKINENRDDYTVLIFSGGNEKLNRKVVSDPRIDILLHPGRNRNDSGFDEPMAKKAAENNVAIGLDFKQIPENQKQRVHKFSNWRKNLSLCEKHNTPYIVTTNPEEVYDLRAPRDLKALIDSLDYDGAKALKKSQEIVQKNKEKLGVGE